MHLDRPQLGHPSGPSFLALSGPSSDMLIRSPSWIVFRGMSELQLIPTGRACESRHSNLRSIDSAPSAVAIVSRMRPTSSKCIDAYCIYVQYTASLYLLSFFGLVPSSCYFSLHHPIRASVMDGECRAGGDKIETTARTTLPSLPMGVLSRLDPSSGTALEAAL